jgi:DNA modification methylase
MTVTILKGDCRDVLRTLPDESVHCVVTSPPYFGLRDYGVDGQIGLEPTPAEFVEQIVGVMREVRRVLRDDGTLWLNLGDSYAGSWGAQARPGGTLSAQQIAAAPKATRTGSLTKTPGLKPKDLIGIPWRVAFALQADGWWLRQDIIWHKPNPMPESIKDRCTKAHEYLFLLAKSERYYWNADAMQETATGRDAGNLTHKHVERVELEVAAGNHRERTKLGLTAIAGTESRNRRSVWSVATEPFAEAHFATFPPALIEPCIKAGCPEGGTVLDPFGGAGTTGLVADGLQRHAVLIELNPAYIDIARRRIQGDAPLFAEVTA